MTPEKFTTTITGSPRIGPNRELKRAVEKYWAGSIDRTELESVAATLRRDTWQQLLDAGLDSVPVNTFSLLRPRARHRRAAGRAARRVSRRSPTIWTGTSRWPAATTTSLRWR